MRTVAIIQAHLSSTRLPRKILADIAGRTMLERVVVRAIEIPGLDHVVVAMPYGDSSLVRDHVGWATRPSPVAISLFGWPGRDDDVLGRYDAAARDLNADVILRITSDCPLLDPEICGRVLRHYLAAGSPAAIVGTREPNGDGFDCEAFSAHLLRLAHLEATSVSDREHVTPWFWERGHRYEITLDGGAPKLSVDTQEDLDRVRAIYKHVGKDIFSRAEALAACATLGIIP